MAPDYWPCPNYVIDAANPQGLNKMPHSIQNIGGTFWGTVSLNYYLAFYLSKYIEKLY